MNREEKIEALAEEYGYDLLPFIGTRLPIADFKAGILAGIKLRDAELLAMEFDENSCRSEAEKKCSIGTTAYSVFFWGARWQFEQFIKAIKIPHARGREGRRMKCSGRACGKNLRAVLNKVTGPFAVPLVLLMKSRWGETIEAIKRAIDFLLPTLNKPRARFNKSTVNFAVKELKALIAIRTHQKEQGE